MASFLSAAATSVLPFEMAGMIVQRLLVVILLVGLLGCRSTSQTHEPSAPGTTGTLVYTCLSGEFWQLWIGSVGEKPQQLTLTPVDKKRPRWSNQGDRLVYQTNNGEIFLINADGTSEVQTVAELGVATEPAWANDDRSLFLTVFRSSLREDSEIWQSPLGDGTPQRLTSEVGLQYNPAPSPDGRWVVYTSGAGETTHELWRIGPDGSTPLQLTDNLVFDILPRWSPDGDVIAFSSNQKGNYDLWRIDADGGSLQQLSDYAGLDTGPAWSPDGQWLAFESNREGQVQIWIMPAAGGEPRCVSPAELICRNVDWGP